jgi:SAM-dependent methyltransferase
MMPTSTPVSPFGSMSRRMAFLLALTLPAFTGCTSSGSSESHDALSVLSAAMAESRSSAALASLETTGYVDGPSTIDGIGRYYRGREISHVMGHLGAGWLERPTREQEERTDLLLDFLTGLGGTTVADIGVGTGYFALPWARRLDGGRVLGVDIQPEMLDILASRVAEEGLTNVEGVLGRIDDPRLPQGEVDVVLIVDAYHEFSAPREMLAGIEQALRPGGRLVLVEYRGEDPLVPIKELHKMTEEQAITEVELAGLEWVVTEDFLPQQHVMIFEKPVG